MRREFSVVRVKKEATSWEFPLAWDECLSSPLAGPLSELEQRRLEATIDRIPHAKRARDGRVAWTIRALDVWMTSDGCFFVEGETTLGAVWELLLDLQQVLPELALEDRITEMVHNERSFFRLVLREQAALAPFEHEAIVAA